MDRRYDTMLADTSAWSEAVAREAVIRPLAEADHLTRLDLVLACRALGLKRTRLYELLDRYRARPVTSSLLPEAPGPRPGARRLSDEVEGIIAAAIRTTYATRQKASINALHQEVRRLCRQRSLRSPSWHTIRARIGSLDPKELATVREGAKIARDRFRLAPETYAVEHALEVVQIDHTLVDLIVVDARHRLPLQRPWLTLAIDVASRMVAGFYLTLEPPSATSVALAIQHLVLAKEPWLDARDLAIDWPVAGLPDAVHVDNAKEFRSQALKRGLEEHGVTLIHRPVARPHYGAHIERLIGTMMGAVHLLPGTTFSDIEERGDYDSARHAAMTLDELERWIALEIARYHGARHASLGIPPRAAWEEAMGRRLRPPRQPYDPARFVLDFLPSTERVVRRDGLHLFGLRYWDDILSVWAGRLSRPLRVTYDPRDLSTVFVRGLDGVRWPVRFAELRRPPITLAEHRRAQAELRARGLALTDEQLIFKTIEAQRAMVEAAVRTTRSARRVSERRGRALAGAGPEQMDSHRGEVAVDPEPSELVDLTPFPVEEWS